MNLKRILVAAIPLVGLSQYIMAVDSCPTDQDPPCGIQAVRIALTCVQVGSLYCTKGIYQCPSPDQNIYVVYAPIGGGFTCMDVPPNGYICSS
jgi:hypothetical protein